MTTAPWPATPRPRSPASPTAGRRLPLRPVTGAARSGAVGPADQGPVLGRQHPLGGDQPRRAEGPALRPPAQRRLLPPRLPQPRGPPRAAGTASTDLSFVGMDDPEHARLRRMVSGAFTIKRVEAMRPVVQEMVDDFIDAHAGRAEARRPGPGVRPAGPVSGDLRTARRPLRGPRVLPDQQQGHRLRRRQPRGRGGPPTANLSDTWTSCLDAKLAEPGDDLLSGLGEQIKAGELTRREAAAMGVLLLLGGHETTANMITLGTLLLLEHPDSSPGSARPATGTRPQGDRLRGGGAAALPHHRPPRAPPDGAGGHRDRRPDHPRRGGRDPARRTGQPGPRRLPRPGPAGPRPRRPPPPGVRLRHPPLPRPAAGPDGAPGRLSDPLPPHPHAAPRRRIWTRSPSSTTRSSTASTNSPSPGRGPSRRAAVPSGQGRGQGRPPRRSMSVLKRLR